MAQQQIIAINTADIAKMLGITREHATDTVTKRPDFPKPVIDLSQRMRRWNQADVLRWIQRKSAH